VLKFVEFPIWSIALTSSLNSIWRAVRSAELKVPFPA
jgi:hypothetical protein